MAAKINVFREKAENIFNKKHKLKSKNDAYSLPQVTSMFSTPGFTIEPLMAIKYRLNETKNLLNSKDIEKWRRHTGKTNPCGSVVKRLRETVKPELCTQAWAKFYEIVSSCRIIPSTCIESKQLTSLHLCEAPGAFIAGLNHYIKSNFDEMHWSWLASTLNPFYEGNDTKRMIAGERFLVETLSHWNFGETYDGDLMCWGNLECLLHATGGSGKVDLVTADGSISCADDPEKQELVIGQLLYCEVVAALVNLARGGALVVKMFTMFESCTVGILFLLCCFFEEVEIIKPGTSKPGNSEVYCICTSFSGAENLSRDLTNKLQSYYTSQQPDVVLFPRESLPPQFLESVINCATKFSEYQIDAINRNIELFENCSKGKWKFLTKLRSYLAEHFIPHFNIQSVGRQLCVVPHVHLDGRQLSYWPEGSNESYCNSGSHHTGSYEERVLISKLGWQDRVVFPQHEITSVVSEDKLVNEILNSVSSLAWLKGDAAMRSDVPNWTVELGKPIKEVQSSRFCSASLIGQLHEARANARVLHTPEGRQLIKNLERLADEKQHKLSHVSHLFNIISVLHKGGLLTADARPRFIDITGNGRFLSQLLKNDVCSLEQCVAMLCQKCGGQCIDKFAECQRVLANSCLGYDTDDVQQLREQNVTPSMVASSDSLGHGTTSILGKSSTSGEPDLSPTKSFQIVLGSVFNGCQLPESYDELASRHLLLNQCVAASQLLGEGDCFICEVSDTLTQFTVGVIYILHLLFKDISLTSPSFCPTPKQLLLCRGFNSSESSNLLAHVKKVSEFLTRKPSANDIISIVPISKLFLERFYKYIRKHSTKHVTAQLNCIINCERLIFSQNAR